MNRKSILTAAATLIVGVVGGAALMLNDSTYNSVKDAIGQGATNNAVGSVSGMTSIDVSSMDLEAAMQMVQSERAKLLDQQLQTQIQDVQNRNEQIAKLNTVQAGLNALRTGSAPYTLSADLKSNLTVYDPATAAKSSLTVGELDQSISKLKSLIDSMSNSQQMDMLRIQSLSNKRNEAFDVMTNFVKKMQESRSSIIGNMR